MGCCVVHDAVERAPCPAKARRSVGCYAQAHGAEAVSAHMDNAPSRAHRRRRGQLEGRCPWRSARDRPQAVLASPVTTGAPQKSCKQLPNPWRSASPVHFFRRKGHAPRQNGAFCTPSHTRRLTPLGLKSCGDRRFGFGHRTHSKLLRMMSFACPTSKHCPVP
jgi:hypothetical protein